MEKVRIIIALLIVALSYGCGGNTDEQAAFDLAAIKVKVAKAKLTSANSFINVSGKVEAVNSANLSTRMMGNVKSRRVKVGDQVKKGQSVLILNSADLLAKKSQVEAGINQATSALKNAEKDYNRFRTLFEKGSASEKELDDMTTRYEMAKAQLEAARQMENEVNAQFTYTHIRAPFHGIVTNTFVKEGDLANPGMPLATVEGTGSYQATLMVAESHISKVDQDAPALVLVKSTGKRLKGTITEISRSSKNTGGQYLVKIDLEHTGDDILSGMFVNAQLTSKEAPLTHLLMIPEKSLVKRGQLNGVYTIDDNNTAILRWLRTGKNEDGMVQILSGLSLGESYIISADGKLFNGAKVSL